MSGEMSGEAGVMEEAVARVPHLCACCGKDHDHYQCDVCERCLDEHWIEANQEGGLNADTAEDADIARWIIANKIPNQ